MSSEMEMLVTRAATEAPRRSRRLAVEEDQANMHVVVKNTFISGANERSPSLEPFFREREVRSCPSSPIGRCHAFLERSSETLSYALSKLQDNDALSEEASTGFSERVSPTPMDSPRSSQVTVVALPSECSEPMWQTPWDAVESMEFMPCTPLDAMNFMPCTPLERFASDVSQTSSDVQELPTLKLTPAMVDPFCGAYAVPQEFCMQPVQSVHPYGFAMASMVPGPVERQDVLSPPLYEVGHVNMQHSWVPPPPARPALGSVELPSVGSALHLSGRCKPCAFLHTKGCASGLSCTFCHLCEPGEKKLRQKEKVQRVRTAIRHKQTRKHVRDQETLANASYAQ